MDLVRWLHCPRYELHNKGACVSMLTKGIGCSLVCFSQSKVFEIDCLVIDRCFTSCYPTHERASARLGDGRFDDFIIKSVKRRRLLLLLGPAIFWQGFGCHLRILFGTAGQKCPALTQKGKGQIIRGSKPQFSLFNLVVETHNARAPGRATANLGRVPARTRVLTDDLTRRLLLLPHHSIDLAGAKMCFPTLQHLSRDKTSRQHDEF